jgi:hypothetical protein
VRKRRVRDAQGALRRRRDRQRAEHRNQSGGPPALVPVSGGTDLLLASPIGTSAGLWALTPSGTVIPLATSIAALVGARSVAMALRDDGTHLAIVAEQGCKPKQAITLAIADFNTAQKTLVGTGDPFRETAIVAGPATVATAPSVAWAAARMEWWVSWIDARQKAMLVRVSADGKSAGAPLELGDANAVALAPDAAPLSGSSAAPLAFLSRPDRPAVDVRAISCPK